MKKPVRGDVWTILSQTDRPILLYGMGNGADKICAVLSDLGKAPSGVFASDGFVRGHAYRDMTVMTWDQARLAFPNPIVLVSFASRLPSVWEAVAKMDRECDLYLPDVPVAGKDLFDAAYYDAHRSEFDRARSLLVDEPSRRVFDSVIRYKLSGRLSDLLDSVCLPDDLEEQIVSCHSIRHVVDVGAYTGDTAREFAARYPMITHLTALEPDRKNFARLEKTADELRGGGLSVSLHRVFAWDQPGTVSFEEGLGRGSVASRADSPDLSRSSADCPADTLDRLLSPGPAADYIKFDVEGAEEQALLGARQILSRDRPVLRVAAYHRSSDLFRLPLLLSELCPDKSLYLRRKPCFPAWEIDLYAL